MTEIQFGWLSYLPLRDVWKHEAQDFTPWLAENIDHLSEAIAIPLELTGIEVVEKPNDWIRQIKQKASSEGVTHYDMKEKFWGALLERHLGLADLGFKVWRYSNNYIVLHEEPCVQLSVWIGKTKSGVYVRSAWGESAEPVEVFLAPHRDYLERTLGVALGPSSGGSHFLVNNAIPKGHDEEESSWPEIMDWMNQVVGKYRDAFSKVILNQVAP